MFIPALLRNHQDHLVLGRIGRYRFFPKFSISPQVRKFHMYVVGLTGRGKSKFLENCIVQDILAGRGCAVVDPHGDLARDVLWTLASCGYFNNSQSYDRIVYVAPRRRDFIIPFNVLTTSDRNLETYEIAQRVISAFTRTWARTLLEPPRFQQIMRSALATLIETQDNLCNLYRLLTDDDFRNAKLQQIKDPKVALDCRSFFCNEFEQWGRERNSMMSSTTNKVSALTDNPSIFYMLGQKENNVDIRKIMDQGKALFVDLGDCDDETKRLFGTLIVTGFEQAALSRARAPLESRKPYYLYIDEFQDFACHPGAAETFSQMLSQVRKFGLHMILANQSIAQLNTRLQTALGNAQTIVTFRISRADAEALARVLGEVNTEAIKRQNTFPSQHPIFSPLNEQWEDFIQFLTRQEVRQATVKTADDRLAVIWSEYIQKNNYSEEALEKIIVECIKRYGNSFERVAARLINQQVTGDRTNVFTN
ncbi:MAG: type IV secretion system DNA-binding domain-containing protein [Anaerolineales bacterium]|nr:type IV secretion system DNA-binding domain-containing protein [Anaerolineales bacterium]